MQKKSHHLSFLPLLILAMLANILAQAVHETGHHLIYQIMGHEPVWAFTKVVQMSEPPMDPASWVEVIHPDGSSNWLKVSSIPPNKTEQALLAGAGPLLGLISAILGLIMVRQSAKVTSKQAWLVYTLSVSLVAVLYYLRAPTRTGGDEYDIAINLGIEKVFVELFFVLGYLACLIVGLRQLETWKTRLTWFGTILLGAVATGLPMVLFDPILIAQVDAGNPWFQSVLGYSLPVFMIILVTCFGVWAWARWRERGDHEHP